MLFVTKHDPNKVSKMAGMLSINTSSLDNLFCNSISRMEGSVCSRCYARRLQLFRSKVSIPYRNNGIILSGRIQDDEIPRFHKQFVRFHSFGELINRNHYHNLVRIAKASPSSTFALWTKNLNAAFPVIKTRNLIHIFSSPCIGRESRIPSGFDKVFTVFNKTDRIISNCVGRCIDCLKCYSKDTDKYIMEVAR